MRWPRSAFRRLLDITTIAPFVPLLFWPGVVGSSCGICRHLDCHPRLIAVVAFVISPVQGAQWINYRKEIAKARQDLEQPHWYKRYNPSRSCIIRWTRSSFPGCRPSTWIPAVDARPPGVHDFRLARSACSDHHSGSSSSTAASSSSRTLSEPSERETSKPPRGRRSMSRTWFRRRSRDVLSQSPARATWNSSWRTPGRPTTRLTSEARERRTRGEFQSTSTTKSSETEHVLDLEEIRRSSSGIAGANIRVTKQEMGRLWVLR